MKKYNVLEKIKDGPYRKYHENGKLKEKGNFRNGKRDGAFEVYHVNGRLLQIIVYEDDEVIDYKRY